jgi:hypothetical protein
MLAPFAVDRRLRKRDEGFGAERHAVVRVTNFVDLEHGARLRASHCGPVSESKSFVTDGIRALTPNS